MKELRTVILYEEVKPNAPISEQVEIGKMTHWQAKRYVNEQPAGKTFFTLTKTEYDRLARPKQKRGRKPKLAVAS